MRFSMMLIAACLVCGSANAQVTIIDKWRNGAGVIMQQDRALLRDFIIGEHMRRCGENETAAIEPCGLPSRAIVRYAPGSFMPRDAEDMPLPTSISARLSPPLPGTAYVYARDSVYLMDLSSRRILDAVSLPSE